MSVVVAVDDAGVVDVVVVVVVVVIGVVFECG